MAADEPPEELNRLRAALLSLGCRAEPPEADALRHLRGRGGDVAAAAAALQATAAWRASVGFAPRGGGAWGGVERLRDCPLPLEPLLLQRWPQSYLGRDALGRPVVLERVADFDPSDLAERGASLASLARPPHAPRRPERQPTGVILP